MFNLLAVALSFLLTVCIIRGDEISVGKAFIENASSSDFERAELALCIAPSNKTRPRHVPSEFAQIPVAAHVGSANGNGSGQQNPTSINTAIFECTGSEEKPPKEDKKKWFPFLS